MGLENFVTIATVLGCSFFGLVAVTSSKGQRLWAVWGCMYTALISVSLFFWKVVGILVFGVDTDWLEVLLVVMLLCAFGVSIVSALLSALR